MIPSSRTGWAIWPNLGIAIGRTKNPIRSLEEGWISRSNQKTIVNIKEAWRSSLAGTIRKEMIDDDYMENPKWNCNHNFIEYTKHSSLHGLKYIGQKDLNNCERFFWGISFILAVSTSAFFIWNLFDRFNNMPVIMSLSPSEIDLSTIPFPAVTVCNMNNFRKQNAKQVLSRAIESEPNKDRKILNDICSAETLDIDKSLKNKTDWDYVLQFILANTQTCKEMLIFCMWKAEQKNCSDLFNPTLTDEGVCCTFNRLPRNNIFSSGQDLSELNISYNFPASHWTPEKGYPPDTVNNALPWRPNGQGVHMGLTIVVDAEIHQYYCSSENSVGFKVIVHNPIETPKVASFGATVPTARETRVEIEPKIMTAEQDLVSIAVSKRKCFFEGEKKLKYYRTYTQRNCYMECEANFTLANCNCVLYYMSKDNDTRVCGGEEMKCAANAQRKVEETHALSEQSQRGNQSCECLPGCWELSYTIQQTASPLSSVLFVRPGFLGGRNITYFAKNMAILHFFFTQKEFTATQREVLYGFTEFLSNTGGILGLFMGFSFVSVVEIIYFLSLRVFCAIRRKKKLVGENANQQATIRPYNRITPFIP